MGRLSKFDLESYQRQLQQQFTLICQALTTNAEGNDVPQFYHYSIYNNQEHNYSTMQTNVIGNTTIVTVIIYNRERKQVVRMDISRKKSLWVLSKIRIMQEDIIIHQFLELLLREHLKDIVDKVMVNFHKILDQQTYKRFA